MCESNQKKFNTDETSKAIKMKYWYIYIYIYIKSNYIGLQFLTDVSHLNKIILSTVYLILILVLDIWSILSKSENYH